MTAPSVTDVGSDRSAPPEWGGSGAQLGKDREKLDRSDFDEAYRRLIERFDDLMLLTRSQLR